MVTFNSSCKTDTIRAQVWSVIHDGCGRAGQTFQLVMVILILLSLAMLPLEFGTENLGYGHVLVILEIVITSFFTIEYCLRIYSAPKRLRYIFSFFGIIDLLSILPFYLGLFNSQFLQSFKILRIIRILRLGEVRAAGGHEMPAAVDEEGHGLLQGDEKILYVVTHHPLYLLFGSIAPMLSTAFGIVILSAFPFNIISTTIAVTLFFFAFILLWRTWLNYSYDLIYITDKRLMFHDQHLFGRAINQLNYHAITNVKPSYTGVLSYMFGYGRLIVETAADQLGHFEFHMARKHEKAAHLIMGKCSNQRKEDLL